MISVDYTFIFEEIIGENGLKRSDIENYKDKVSAAIDSILSDHKENKLSFLELPEKIDVIEKIENYVKSIRFDYKNIIIVGIGGSSLGVQAIYQALLPYYHNLFSEPKILFLENVDPETISEFFERVKIEDSMAVVITKSGSTAETMSQFMILKNYFDDRLKDKAAERIAVVTDPAKGDLLKIAKKEGYATFEIPQNVGGRFSVLTPVGLLPAELAGIPSRKILEGAERVLEKIKDRDVFKNPSALIAVILIEFFKRGKNIFVMFPYSSKLYLLADWFRQLWAESLGKKYDRDGKEIKWGQTPVKALGAVDQHSQVQLYIEGPDDKVFGFIEVEEKGKDIAIPEILKDYSSTSYLGGHKISELIDSEKRGTELALAKNGRPGFTYKFDRISPENIGEFFITMEMQTAIAGEILNINTYDQPGVELGKKLTYAFLGRKGYDLSEVEDILKKLRK